MIVPWDVTTSKCHKETRGRKLSSCDSSLQVAHLLLRIEGASLIKVCDLLFPSEVLMCERTYFKENCIVPKTVV